MNHIALAPTQLHKILPAYTAMPVELITERLSIEPNHVYIIPENRDLHVENGEFLLKPISKRRGWPDVITVFLRSLIEYWDGKLIAVIVSGYDGDGAAAPAVNTAGVDAGMEPLLPAPQEASVATKPIARMGRSIFFMM